jgi:hypothetical protein
MSTYPGKFEGCGDDDGLGEILYDITMDGCCEELGDVESFGWYAKVDHDGRWFIVEENSQGFFDYTEYADEQTRENVWSTIEDEYASFSERDD